MDLDIHNNTYTERLTVTVGYCVCYATGLTCCGLVLFVTFYGKMYENRVNLLVANAAVGDFLVDLSNAIMQPVNVMSETKWFACSWCGWITYITGMEANWFISVIVLNRYVSIFYPASFKRIYTTRNIIFMIIGGWMVPLLFTMPFHVSGHTGFEEQYMFCGMSIKTENDLLWQILEICLLIVPTFLTDVVTIYCNVRIFYKLRDHAKNPNSTLKNNVMSQNKQLMYLTLIHTGFSVLLQSPVMWGKLMPSMVEGNFLRILFPWLFLFNSTITPFTTLWVLKPYRRVIAELFCRGGNQVQPLINHSNPTNYQVTVKILS